MASLLKMCLVNSIFICRKCSGNLNRTGTKCSCGMEESPKDLRFRSHFLSCRSCEESMGTVLESGRGHRKDERQDQHALAWPAEEECVAWMEFSTATAPKPCAFYSAEAFCSCLYYMPRLWTLWLLMQS